MVDRCAHKVQLVQATSVKVFEHVRDGSHHLVIQGAHGKPLMQSTSTSYDIRAEIRVEMLISTQVLCRYGSRGKFGCATISPVGKFTETLGIVSLKTRLFVIEVHVEKANTGEMRRILGFG